MANSNNINNMLEYINKLWYIRGDYNTSYPDRYSAYCAAVALMTKNASGSRIPSSSSKDGVDEKAVKKIVEDLLKKEQSFTVHIENPMMYGGKICGFLPIFNHGTYKITAKNCTILDDMQQFNAVRTSKRFSEKDGCDVYFFDSMLIDEELSKWDVKDDRVILNLEPGNTFKYYYDKLLKEKGTIFPLYLSFDKDGYLIPTQTGEEWIIDEQTFKEDWLHASGRGAAKRGNTKASEEPTEEQVNVDNLIVKYWQKVRNSFRTSIGLPQIEFDEETEPTKGLTRDNAKAPEEPVSEEEKPKYDNICINDYAKILVVPNQIVPLAYITEIAGINDTDLKDYARNVLTGHLEINRNGIPTRLDYSIAKFTDGTTVYIPSASMIFYCVMPTSSDSCEIVFEKQKLDGSEEFRFKPWNFAGQDPLIDRIMNNTSKKIMAASKEETKKYGFNIINTNTEEPRSIEIELATENSEEYEKGGDTETTSEKIWQPDNSELGSNESVVIMPSDDESAKLYIKKLKVDGKTVYDDGWKEETDVTVQTVMVDENDELHLSGDYKVAEIDVDNTKDNFDNYPDIDYSNIAFEDEPAVEGAVTDGEEPVVTDPVNVE